MEEKETPNPTSMLELCLDFTDTVDWRTSDHAEDKITSYAELLEWSRDKGIISEEEQEALRFSLQGKDALARKVVGSAYQLRESIYRIFSALAHGRNAEPKDLDTLNEFLAKSLGKLQLRSTGASFDWGWRDTESADMILWPIARSAADLLTSDELTRVRECANEEEGCGSLFLDFSKSQTKKWCSMDSCGNRVKFRTYYERHKHTGHSRPTAT